MAIKDIYEAIVNLNDAEIVARVQAELDGGTAVTSILQEGLIAALDEVGRRFSEGDMFVPEMLKAAQVMKEGLEVIKPHLTEGEMPSSGTVVLGTVKGDLHDIGKNLVAMMMEGAGFKVVDLGSRFFYCGSGPLGCIRKFGRSRRLHRRFDFRHFREDEIQHGTNIQGIKPPEVDGMMF